MAHRDAPDTDDAVIALLHERRQLTLLVHDVIHLKLVRQSRWSNEDNGRQGQGWQAGDVTGSSIDERVHKDDGLAQLVSRLCELLVQVIRVGLEDSDDDDFLCIFQLLLHFRQGLVLFRSRSHLRSHVLDDAVRITRSLILLRELARLEDFQGGVAGHSELAADLLSALLIRAVHFRQRDSRIRGLEGRGSLLVLRGQALAVTAPWSDWDEHVSDGRPGSTQRILTKFDEDGIIVSDGGFESIDRIVAQVQHVTGRDGGHSQAQDHISGTQRTHC